MTQLYLAYQMHNIEMLKSQKTIVVSLSMEFYYITKKTTYYILLRERKILAEYFLKYFLKMKPFRNTKIQIFHAATTSGCMLSQTFCSGGGKCIVDLALEKYCKEPRFILDHFSTQMNIRGTIFFIRVPLKRKRNTNE